MLTRTRGLVLAAVCSCSALLLAACVPAPPGSGGGTQQCPTGVQDPAGGQVSGIPYGSGFFRVADILPACTADAVGTIMYVHGGGYTGGSRSEAQWPAIDHVRNLGWAVVTVDYRLAPWDTWPAQPNDVRSAIQWWRTTGAAQYDLPAQPLVGMGWSAGGQIAEWVLLEDTGPSFDAAVSISGSTWWPDRPTAGATQALFGLPGMQSMSRMIEASSLSHIDPQDPPLLHIHGANDSVVHVSQAQLLADAIAGGDGDPTRHTVLLDPTCGHSQNCMTPSRIDPFLDSLATP